MVGMSEFWLSEVLAALDVESTAVLSVAVLAGPMLAVLLGMGEPTYVASEPLLEQANSAANEVTTHGSAMPTRQRAGNKGRRVASGPVGGQAEFIEGLQYGGGALLLGNRRAIAGL
jgi:hypothetical protein